MYESFFQFREKPFSLIPDVGFVYLGKQHGAALAMLQYGLTNEAAITVITGEVGSGKTTLIRHMVEHVDRNETTIGLINSPHRSFGELLQWVLLAFGLEYREKDPVERYQNFIDFLNTEYADGRRTILIVDEAQNLSPDTIEELRMLTNINANKRLALQLILVGQSELRATLSQPELKQFVQRVSVDYNIESLDEDETRNYIRHRIQVAGGNPSVFEEGCHLLIHHYADGIPRMINSICNTALEYAYASKRSTVTADMIEEVAQDRAKGGLFELPKIDYFRGLKNLANPAPSLSRQNVENLLQLPEQSEPEERLVRLPEQTETDEPSSPHIAEPDAQRESPLQVPDPVAPSFKRSAVTETRTPAAQEKRAPQRTSADEQDVYAGKLLTTEHGTSAEIFLEYDLVIDELLAFFRRRKVT